PDEARQIEGDRVEREEVAALAAEIRTEQPGEIQRDRGRQPGRQPRQRRAIEPGDEEAEHEPRPPRHGRAARANRGTRKRSTSPATAPKNRSWLVCSSIVSDRARPAAA